MYNSGKQTKTVISTVVIKVVIGLWLRCFSNMLFSASTRNDKSFWEANSGRKLWYCLPESPSTNRRRWKPKN
eukprot:scaffold305_cov110-Cylindrotheca_fusiformis.AAC.22